MDFTVLPYGSRVPAQGASQAYLLTDNWDDWFTFSTLYSLIIFDAEGKRHDIGGVKIGQFGMAEGQRRADIPQQFQELGEAFFSLGQDDSYYTDLDTLGAEVRIRVLTALRDMAYDADLFERALPEAVTRTSLLRSVSTSMVAGQFHRIAHGGARLTRYEFRYTSPLQPETGSAPLELDFVVEPVSFPPTNIHVLIGRNGVGKTTLLNNMARSIVDEVDPELVGQFTAEPDNPLDDGPAFANLVSVTFSAFDPFEPLHRGPDQSDGVRYAYIGLARERGNDGKVLPPKSPEDLSGEFAKSVVECRLGARSQRLRRALETLEADPIFRDEELAALASDSLERKEAVALARGLFSSLSSGHKIVLLTIARLVETVEEKTLVLLDEPEAHLHPPLLSSFIRSLSDLLIDRNGVAVIATHSPVVLQEVPRGCVWIIRRLGGEVDADRPQVETFGESVGVLTREVFGLEVTQSGFHKMLRESVAKNPDFEAVIREFGGELGGEARAIIQALIAARQQDG